jgi:serine/threonine protein phosphatase 1
MPRRIAISDIHGCSITFGTLVKRLGLQPGDELFLLGDFIDRGADSKGVIDRVWDLAAQGIRTHCLRGNHEQMLLDHIDEPEYGDFWLYNGGRQTLASFGVEFARDLPATYVDWMRELPLYLETSGYLLVHAGIDFRSEAPLQEESALLWWRNWYDTIDRDWLGDRIVIHGHTPRSRHLIKNQLQKLDYQPVLNIDAGCVFSHSGMGHLCAFDLDEQQVYFEPRVATRA